ncbi:hypothetical protein ACIBQ1_15850 [Nonomuraea sp. NPDC050153]|uniref:hypothetical protein n=1 Tax=Nonomuraea sp. NPDC050153 TaxID=3364359 RepID=UPI0037A3239F
MDFGDVMSQLDGGMLCSGSRRRRAGRLSFADAVLSPTADIHACQTIYDERLL